MSAPEVAAPVVAVEESNPAETVPTPETSVPAAEAPKLEEVAPVRLSFVYPFCSFRDSMQGCHQDRTSSSEYQEWFIFWC